MMGNRGSNSSRGAESDSSVDDPPSHLQPNSETIRRTLEDNDDMTSAIQLLIRSGQVHIVSRGEDDDDFVIVSSDDEESSMDCCTIEEFLEPKNRKIKYVNLENKINENEISLTTKMKSGLLHPVTKKRPNNLVNMLFSRQIGACNNGSFTLGDRCKIGNNYLPNTMETLFYYESKGFCGVHSNDGEQFLVACQDRVIRVYNVKDRKFEQSDALLAHDVGWSILDVAFSPDRSHVAYSTWSDSLHIFKLDETKEQKNLPLLPERRRFCIFSIVFSSDGKEILGGGNDGCLYVFNRELNQRILRIPAHGVDVNTVAFADATSHIFYSGSDDGLCKVWDRRTLNEINPTPVGILAGHQDGITFIDSKGDSRYFISNSKDQSIKLWDIRHFSSQKAQENAKKAVSNERWDYRFQCAPSRFVNRDKTSYTVEGDTSVMTYRGHNVLQTLVRCRFSPEFSTGNRYIYTGCASGSIFIYDLLTGKLAKRLSGHELCVRDVSWHPDGRHIVSTSWDNYVHCWYYTDKSVVDQFENLFQSDGDDSDDPDYEPGKPLPKQVVYAVALDER